MKKMFFVILICFMTTMIGSTNTTNNNVIYRYNWGMTINEIKIQTGSGSKGLSGVVKTTGSSYQVYQYMIPFPDPPVSLIGKNASIYLSMSTDLEILTKIAFAIRVKRGAVTQYSNAIFNVLDKKYGSSETIRAKSFWKVNEKTFATIANISIEEIGVVYGSLITPRKLYQQASNRIALKLREYYTNN